MVSQSMHVLLPTNNSINTHFAVIKKIIYVNVGPNSANSQEGK